MIAAMHTKYFIMAGAVALGTSLGAAETNSITTRNGITYTNAVIQRADPDGVVVEYAPQPGSVGLAKLKFANLPDELRKQYNYNPTEAETFEQNQAAGVARLEEQIAQGEIEKRRRNDLLVQLRAEQDEMKAKRQESVAMAAAQMEMGGWYGGYYDDGDWYGIGDRRFRFNSRGPLNPHGVDSTNSSSGVGLSDLGTGWGDSGHFGPLPSHGSNGPSQSGASRGPAPRGNPSERSFPDRSR